MKIYIPAHIQDYVSHEFGPAFVTREAAQQWLRDNPNELKNRGFIGAEEDIVEVQVAVPSLTVQELIKLQEE
jgi:hypothetical protein